jgi:hypothetical protein
MPLNWDIHRCTYYCQGDIHAIPLLVRAGTTADDITQIFTQGLEADMELLSVRPALEADVATWQHDIFQDCEGWRSDGGRGQPSAATKAQMTTPFLALVQLKEEGTRDDPA